MIDSLRGKLIDKETGLAVVECGGVGYALRTTLYTLEQLGDIGGDVFVYTHLSVREDNVELFGFSSKRERECFRLLITVSGVGPRAALSILSDLAPDKFLFTVASGDAKTLTKVKGIGAKTAQRVVMELKDKISGDSVLSAGSSEMVSAAPSASDNILDALEALESLGYAKSDTMPLLSALDPALPATELIRRTLQEIGKQR